MSPRETIAFLLTAPSKSQAVNGFVGLAGAQMGLKYGFMSLFCIVKGQQEQEIIAEPLIYGERRPLAPLLARAIPAGGCFRGAGWRGARWSPAPAGRARPCLGFPKAVRLRVGIPLGTAAWMSPARLHPLPCGGGGGTPRGEMTHPRRGRASSPRSIPVARGARGRASRRQPRCPSAVAPARWGGVGRAGGALARPAPRAALSCFANPAWHLPQLPAASREQGTN